MTLDQLITLFEDIEAGVEGQLLGFHLHASIRQLEEQTWPTNDRYGHRFSDFLKALRDHPAQNDIHKNDATAQGN